jgi:hypothetical protein
MNTLATPRPPLTTIDRAILTLHGLTAAVVGVIAVFSVNGPEFGGLQRIVIVMMIGLWAGGIMVMAVIARLFSREWVRVAILVAGPFIGIVFVVGTANGWSFLG